MDKEVTLHDLKLIAKSWYIYLLSKWQTFLLIGIVFGLLGVIYAYLDKPVYTAELTFTSENEGSGGLNSYAGIAAQFGFNLGGGSNSAFEGDNLMYLMQSRKIIERALFSSVTIGDKNELLVNYYLNFSKRKEQLEKKGFSGLTFSLKDTGSYNRGRDSVLQLLYTDIGKELQVQKVDKKVDVVSVRLSDENELFAKVFVEKLVDNVIQYYTDYKVKKIRQNVLILQRQTDSVRSLITGNIVDIAVSNDLNVNPTRQIVRTGVQRKQVDAQVNGALYTELVKNLELSKLSLRKETPLIQIIDTPMLPLEKKKMGRLFTGVLFTFIGVLLTAFYFIIKKAFG